jgi:hypothetical protein
MTRVLYNNEVEELIETLLHESEWRYVLWGIVDYSVWELIRKSVWNSVQDSVRNSVWELVVDSAWELEWNDRHE